MGPSLWSAWRLRARPVYALFQALSTGGARPVLEGTGISLRGPGKGRERAACSRTSGLAAGTIIQSGSLPVKGRFVLRQKRSRDVSLRSGQSPPVTSASTETKAR